MKELTLLSALAQSQQAFRKLEPLLGRDEFSGLGEIIFGLIKDYYDRDGSAERVDVDVVSALANERYPKHAKDIVGIFARMDTTSVKNVTAAFLEHKRNVAGLRLGQKLVAGQADSVDEELEAFQKYYTATAESLDDDEGGVFIGQSVTDIVQHFQRDNLIRIYPEQLNERLGGGVPPGTHLLFFAPPEVGKSATAITVACGGARDGRKVLYVGNEDPHPAMLSRIVSRLSMMTRDECLANPEEADRRARANGYENIVFASLAPGTLADIRRLVKEHKPEMVVVDQLHNLYVRNMSKVEKLEYLAAELRAIGKETGAVMVSLTQGADTAIGKRVLEMGDVYYSNVAIQAAVDVMIGIGMTREDEMSGQRTFSLCKNKNNGVHEPVQVRINPALSRVY